MSVRLRKHNSNYAVKVTNHNCPSALLAEQQEFVLFSFEVNGPC